MSKRGGEYLYVLVNFPFLWFWKIGITGNMGRRLRENSRNVPGWYVPVVWVKIPNAYAVEQWLLEKTCWTKTTVFGRGGREVRNIFGGVMAMVTVMLLLILKYLLILGLIVGVFWMISH